MDQQIRAALRPFEDDLWLELRLHLNQIHNIIDGFNGEKNRDSKDRETVANWSRFLRFLEDFCSGGQFVNEKQWGELMNLMSISRKLNHRSVKFRDILKNKQLIEANSKNIRQLDHSARLGQTIGACLRELEVNLVAGGCELDLSSVHLSETLVKLNRYLQNNCWPLVRTLKLELNSKLIEGNGHPVDQWRASSDFLERSLRTLSDFVENLCKFERNLDQLRPLVMSVADRNGRGQPPNSGRQQQLDDSLNSCKVTFKQLLSFHENLVETLRQHQQHKHRPVTKGKLPLMSLINKKTGDFVKGDILTDSLLVNLEKSRQCRQRLDRIMSSLRLEFGRFYFVNNLELLTIISLDCKLISDCHLEQNKHLISKLFNNSISGFELAKPTGPQQSAHITGVQSPLGELVPLWGEEPVPLKKKVNVYSVEIVRILNEVMRKLRRSLRRLLRDYLADKTRSDGPACGAWMSSLPVQLANLAEQVSFTERVESDFSNLDKILQLYEQRFKRINRGDEIRDPLRKSAALSMSVQFISCLMKLIKQQVSSEQDWRWQKLTRYYLLEAPLAPGASSTTTDVDSSEMWQVEVRLANAKFSYKFDYLAVQVDTQTATSNEQRQQQQQRLTYKRLISTETSDRCFLVASQAVARLKLGASPSGPAGSGKTETIKALGQALGCQVVVHNCDESNEPEALDRLVWGLAHTGLWGCFDEFNRLASSALSSVSASLELIQTSLREATCTLELPAALGGAIVSIDPASAFFITLNPADELKYRGRRQLPANLRALFLPISMVQVDVEAIVGESLLASANSSAMDASQAGQLGQLMAQWLEQMRAQQLAPNRCEWDLRLVMAVLRRLKLMNSGRQAQDSEKSLLLVEAIRSEVGARLSSGERKALEHSLRNICHQREQVGAGQLDCSSLERQLELQLETRPGVILIGPSKSGKSTCWRQLHASRHASDVRWFALNPKSCTKDNLFGGYHSAEDDGKRESSSSSSSSSKWIDGQLTKLVRDSLELLRDEQDNGHLRQVWIVLDGGIDPDWIESLNSALDDNQVLTLSSGERLDMFVVSPGADKKSIKLIFETNSLEFASPATISRLGLVYFEGNSAASVQAPLAPINEHKLTKTNSSDDDKLLKSFLLADQSTANQRRLLLLEGASSNLTQQLKQIVKTQPKLSCLEYNCSQLTNASHLVDLLSRQPMDILLVNNIELVQEEDQWRTSSFLELIRFILTYGCYYDDQLTLVECNKLKFIVCLKSRLVGEFTRNHSRLISLASDYIKTSDEETNSTNSSDMAVQVQQVANEEALVEVALGESDETSSIMSLEIPPQATCLEETLSRTGQTNLVLFNNSNQIRMALERMQKVLQRESSSSSSGSNGCVFLLTDLQLSLMEQEQKRRLFHLLNLFKLTEANKNRFLFVSSDLKQESPLWSSMGPVYCVARPTGNSLKEMILNSLRWTAEEPGWLVDKICLLVGELEQNQNSLGLFLRVFSEISKRSLDNLGQLNGSLTRGLECLARFEQSIEQIKRQRNEDDRQLSQTKQTIEALMGQLGVKLAQAKGRKEQVAELRELQTSKTEQVVERRGRIQTELNRVIPLMEASKQQVNKSLKPEALNEIKTLRSPPKTIKDILDVLFILLGQSDSSWASIKSYLARGSLRDELASYDFEARLQDGHLIRRVEAEMTKRRDSFQAQQATRASSAIVPVLDWIRATVEYGKVLVKLAPLNEELRCLQLESEQISSTMERMASEQADIEEQVQRESNKLQELQLELGAAEKRSARVRRELEEAQAIRANVTSQANRWRRRLEAMREFEHPKRQLSYCLLATCLTLYCFSGREQQQQPKSLQYYAKLLNLDGQQQDDRQLLNKIANILLNADIGDLFDLSSLVGKEQSQEEDEDEEHLLHVSQLIVLHILTSIDCQPPLIPFLGLDSLRTNREVSRDEFASYFGFKNSLLLGQPDKDLLLIQVKPFSPNNTALRMLEQSLKQANKLILIELAAADKVASEILDIIDVLKRIKPTARTRLVFVGQLKETCEPFQRLIRPICMQAAGGCMLLEAEPAKQVARDGKSQACLLDKLKSKLIDLFVSLQEPKLREATSLIEQELRAKQNEFKTIELNLLSRLTLSAMDGPNRLPAPPANSLSQHYELIKVLNESYESHSQLELSLVEMRSKLNELAKRKSSFEDLGQKCAKFYLDFLHQYQGNAFHRVGPERFAELVLKCLPGRGLEHLLASVMRPMQSIERQKFTQQLVEFVGREERSLIEFASLFGATKAEDNEPSMMRTMEETIRLANERAANLKLTLEEALGELSSGGADGIGAHKWPRLMLLVHDWRRSSPQLELDELLRRLSGGGAGARPSGAPGGGDEEEEDDEQNKSSICLSYHKLYATTDVSRAAAPTTGNVNDVAEETSGSSLGSSNQLETNLIKILETPQVGGPSGRQTIGVVCIANAHLASNWLNSRLLQLIKGSSRNNNNNNNDNNDKLGRFLIILVAESTPANNWQVFAGNVLDEAQLKCWHDELSLQLLDRYNLLINLINCNKSTAGHIAHGKQTNNQKQQQQRTTLLINGLVLFHVVCQELTTKRDEWHSQNYTFDYNQLNLALKMLRQNLDDQPVQGNQWGLEQARCLWCHQLANIVYGARMESRRDEEKLAKLIGEFLGSESAICEKLERLARIMSNRETRRHNLEVLSELID